MAPTVHKLYSTETLDHLSGSQLANLCGLRMDEVQELVDYGALQCAFAREGLDYFDAASLSHLLVACKQRRDYDLDLFSVVIVVPYLREIADLKIQLRQLQAR